MSRIGTEDDEGGIRRCDICHEHHICVYVHEWQLCGKCVERVVHPDKVRCELNWQVKVAKEKKGISND